MTARWERADGVLSRRTLDRVLLLAPSEPDPIELGGTGVVVWDLLARPRSLDDLVAELADRYGTAAAVIASDVEPALRALARRGAVRPRP